MAATPVPRRYLFNRSTASTRSSLRAVRPLPQIHTSATARAYSSASNTSRHQTPAGVIDRASPPTANFLGFRIFNTSPSSYRAFHCSARYLYQDPNMTTAPPKHQMFHFPGLIASTGIADGNFRKVLHTGLYSQLVTMEVPVKGDIGDEVHTVDQILIFTAGTGRAEVAGKKQNVKAGDVVIVPAGTQHQFVNTGDKALELITVYSPAEHNTQTVHKTKEEGDKEEDDGIDVAPDWSRKSKAENEKAGKVKLDGGPYDE